MATDAAAAASGVALGGSKSNPSGSGPCLRLSGKPVALADITNTGRPNPARPISVADVLKENAKLAHLLGEKTKIIEISSAEINKLRFALHATRQQNLIFAQTNSQILAELNQGKDRLKALQHELGCATAMLKVKASELERKNNASNQDQLPKEVTSQVIKAAPSKLSAIEAYQGDNEDTSANVNVHHLVQSQSAVPSNTVHQEPPPDKTNNRMSMSRRTNKQKSESCEGTKDSKIVQHIYKSHEDPRNALRRRSARLNSGSSEMTDVSFETSHKAIVVPSASSLSVPKLNDPSSGKDMSKSKQDGPLCDAAVRNVKTTELKKNGINKQSQKEATAEEEIPEAHSRAAGVEVPKAHTNDDRATDTNRNNFAKAQSSLPFNIQHPEPPQERANKRGANKRKLESCEGQNDSNIEKAKLHSTFSEPLHHVETRKSLRRKSARLTPGSCEVTSATLETELEDEIAPLAPSGSIALTGQRKSKKQNDCRSSTEPSEVHATGRLESTQEDDIAASAPSDSSVLIEKGSKEKQNDSRSSMEPSEQQAAMSSSSQVTGRRSSMRATGKAVSYKEIPLNVKMRRP